MVYAIQNVPQKDNVESIITIIKYIIVINRENYTAADSPRAVAYTILKWVLNCGTC